MLKKIWVKYRQLILYMVFGFMAAVVNISAFWLLHTQLSEHYLFSNTLAWVIATLFSFVTTKRVVFKAKSPSLKHWLMGFCSFMITRVFSYFFDTGIMFLGVTVFKWDPLIAKIIDQLLVGIFNYLTSRIIFMEHNRKMLLAANLKRRRKYLFKRKQTGTRP